MPTAMTLPPAGTPFGERVRARLRQERLIWFTVVGGDGTPQPNPVWFVWDGDVTVLIYNRPDAKRLAHLAARERVSLHFDGDGEGGDIVVLSGVARPAPDAPPPSENASYLDKYRDAMARISGSVEAFGVAYGVALRVELTRVRGF